MDNLTNFDLLRLDKAFQIGLQLRRIKVADGLKSLPITAQKGQGVRGLEDPLLECFGLILEGLFGFEKLRVVENISTDFNSVSSSLNQPCCPVHHVRRRRCLDPPRLDEKTDALFRSLLWIQSPCLTLLEGEKLSRVKTRR